MPRERANERLSRFSRRALLSSYVTRKPGESRPKSRKALNQTRRNEFSRPRYFLRRFLMPRQRSSAYRFFFLHEEEVVAGTRRRDDRPENTRQIGPSVRLTSSLYPAEGWPSPFSETASCQILPRILTRRRRGYRYDVLR